MRRHAVRSILLCCGIASSILYVVINVVTPLRFPGYSIANQTVGELSAIGAPSRELWVPLGRAYAVLVIAFGSGVWISAGTSRRLRVVSGLLIAYGAAGLFWPPMHLRGGEFTRTDTAHIVFAAITVLLMLLAISAAMGAFGTRFRAYSMATLLVLVVFGLLTSLQAPQISANLPTPWIGIWERINIAAFLAWIVVLASTLMRKGHAREGLPGA